MATIYEHCKTPQEFWDLVKDKFLIASYPQLNKPRILTAFWLCSLFYWKFKGQKYWGEWEYRIDAIGVDLASLYYELDNKRKLHDQVFPNIEKWWRMINVKTKVADTGREFETAAGWDNEWGTGKSGKTIIQRNDPFQSTDLTSARYGGHARADFLLTELNIMSGSKTRATDWTPENKKMDIKPDYTTSTGARKETGKGHYHKARSIDTAQQPQQKVSQIIRCFKLVEFSIGNEFNKLWYHFHNFSYPMGKLITDPYTGMPAYKTKEEIEEEVLPPEIKKKREEDVGFVRLSHDGWKNMFRGGEMVEESYDLENTMRYKKYLQKIVVKQGGSTKEITERCIRYCEKLIEAFGRPILWPPISEFSKVMNSITGFQSFKTILGREIKIVGAFRKIGKTPPQICTALGGRPGVGKTEIVKRLGKALWRPVKIINAASQTDPKILEGISASYKGTQCGGLLEAFTEVTFNTRVSVEDLKAELNTIKNYPNVLKNQATERQKELIKKINDQITFIENGESKHEGRVVDYIMEDRLSQAPIILVDEYEKSGDLVKDAMGKISDPNANTEFTDLFLNFPINLSKALIFITFNWLWDPKSVNTPKRTIPDFIDSRFDFVLIELLTFSQRLKIARKFLDGFLYEYFPATDSSGKVDEELNEQNEKRSILTPLQEHVRNMFFQVGAGYNANADQEDLIIRQDFLAWIADEQWGVRGVLINLKKTIKFLKEVETDDRLMDLTDLASPDEKKATFEDNGKGETNLTYKIRGEKYILSLNYKRDKDFEMDDDTGIRIKKTVGTKSVDSIINVFTEIRKSKGAAEDWPEISAYNRGWMATGVKGWKKPKAYEE